MTTNPGNAVGTNGAYRGRTSVNAFNDVLSQFSGRGILSGWKCQPQGDMNITLGGTEQVRDVAILENDIGQKTTLNNISTNPIPITLEAASELGSRIDVIVGYVNNPPDMPVVDPIPVDSPDVCGLIAVSSNTSANPTVPDETMIRNAITADGASGSAAYYAVLAIIEIPAGLTTITGNLITQGTRTPKLVSGVDIKTLNNYSLAGQGNLPSTVKFYEPLYDTASNTYSLHSKEGFTTPIDGMHIIIKPGTASATGAKLKVSPGDTARAIYFRAATTTGGAGNFSAAQALVANGRYELVYQESNQIWICLNYSLPIQTGDIADKAVTTSKLSLGAQSGGTIRTFWGLHAENGVIKINDSNFAYSANAVFRIISDNLGGASKIQINNGPAMDLDWVRNNSSPSLQKTTLKDGWNNLTLVGVNDSTVLIIGGYSPRIESGDIAPLAVHTANIGDRAVIGQKIAQGTINPENINYAGILLQNERRIGTFGDHGVYEKILYLTLTLQAGTNNFNHGITGIQEVLSATGEVQVSDGKSYILGSLNGSGWHESIWAVDRRQIQLAVTDKFVPTVSGKKHRITLRYTKS